MDEQELQLLLARAPGLTVDQLRRLAPDLAQLGARLGRGAPNARRNSEALAAADLTPAAARWLAAPDWALVARDRAWLQRERIQLLDGFSPTYPPQLAMIPDAPAVLFVWGDPLVLASPQLAIVGSRNPTPGGLRTAAQFAGHFAQSGLTLTSGLALGIDAAVHEGTLTVGGWTVAVLGSGLDLIYPPQHHDLAARISRQGAVISEFPPGTPPRREHFPQRNRLISGLALGTLVVEAARHSGSLVTARLAGEQGREVFAIPGSIHNALVRGCHQLIRCGAKLVECADDVLSELKFPVHKQEITGAPDRVPDPGRPLAGLDNDYKILLDGLGFEPTSIDTLVDRTGLSSQSVASMLLILELEGRVGRHTGGRYVRLDQELDPGT